MAFRAVDRFLEYDPNSVMRAIEKRLKRNLALPKWDILIEPMSAA